MKLLERFRVAVISLVLVATIAFCVSQRDFTLFLLTGPLALLSWYVTEGPRGRVLPRWAQNFLLLALLAWTGYDLFQMRDVSDTMGLLGRFVLWLMLIKLYGRKQPRDYAHVLALSAVLVMAGTLQSIEFSFALLVFVYAALALWSVLLFQLWSAREQMREQRRLAVAAAQTAFGARSMPASLVPVVQPAFGRSVLNHFRRIAGASVVLGAILSVVVFIIFPRELSEAARREARFGSPTSGFSEEVKLFTNDRINESRREVFTVEWRDRRGDVMQARDPLYFRGAVLERYNPRDARWMPARRAGDSYSVTTTPRGSARDPKKFEWLSSQAIDDQISTFIQRVTMRSLASEVVFSVWAPIGIACDDGRHFLMNRSTLILRDTNADRVSRIASYEVKVQPYATEATLRRLAGGDVAPSPPRDVSFPVPSIVDFARQRLAEMKLTDVPDEAAARANLDLRWQRNRRISRALRDWLQSEAFSYTTDLGAFVRVGDEDPIQSFLTRYRFGHCEYFASALVAMCQSLNIESRLVTGYIGIEYDDTIQQYVVRESNAHAWAEVRVGDYGWMTLDPTPQSELAALQERNRSWADRWRWAWDRMEFLWNSQVVAFDSGTQATLADRLGSAWQRHAREWSLALLERARAVNNYFRLGPAGYLWLGLVGFAGILAVLSVISVRRRGIRLREATGLKQNNRAARQILRQTRFWLDALDVLARHQVPKPVASVPRQHVDALRTTHPAAAERFSAIVDLYYRVRFAGEELDGGGREQAKTLVAQLDRTFRR